MFQPNLSREEILENRRAARTRLKNALYCSRPCATKPLVKVETPIKLTAKSTAKERQQWIAQSAKYDVSLAELVLHESISIKDLEDYSRAMHKVDDEKTITQRKERLKRAQSFYGDMAQVDRRSKDLSAIMATKDQQFQDIAKAYE